MGGPGVLSDRRFRRLLASRTVSVLGNGFSRVALVFTVLALPGATTADLSIVLACQALPQLVFVLAGGVIGDRFSRYQVMVAADALAATAWSVIAVLVLTGQATVADLAAGAAVGGLATAMFLPAVTGVVTEFIEPARLQSANVALRLGQNTALAVGLALSGVTVAVLGPGWALALNAASFAASAALVTRMRLPPRRPRHSPAALTGPSAAGRPAVSVLVDLRLGWREFASRQWLWVVDVQFAFIVPAVNATVGVLGPLEAEAHLGGARTWGVLVAGQSLGTIAGATLAGRVHPRRPILAATWLTFILAGPMLTLGLGAPAGLTFTAMLACGIANDILAVLWVTTVQREIPEHVISRVSSYDLLTVLSFAPLGLLVAGPAASATSPRAALLCCAALVVIPTGAALTSPGIRHLSVPSDDSQLSSP